MNLGRAYFKVVKVLDAMTDPTERDALVRSLDRYRLPSSAAGALTDAERSRRYRERHAASRDRHEERDEGVTDQRDETVTNGVTPVPLTLPSCITPSSSSDPTTAVNTSTKSRKKQEIQEACDRLIDFLNEKAGRSYRKSAANRALISARLCDGFTEQNLRGIIARKVREWHGTDMAQYLRPETLFNRTKCESYLGERTPENTHV